MHRLQGMFREAGLRLESRGRLPEVRISEDREAAFEVRPGQGFERRILLFVFKLGVRRLFSPVLRRLQVGELDKLTTDFSCPAYLVFPSFSTKKH